MGDEPRRSVRATKGQHTKSLDILDQPTDVSKKRGKKGAASKKSASQEAQSPLEDEDAEIIRCICGVTEQDDESDESWIACENCTAWQHNVCMGITADESVLTDMEYYCEQCRPENHQELLQSIARNDKPPLWEKRRAEHEQAELDAQKAKKGKKGKGKRTSDAKIEPEQNGKMKAKSQTPVATPDPKKDKKEVTQRASSAKRKATGMEGSLEDSAKQNKIPKTATQAKSSNISKRMAPADIPATLEALQDKARIGVGKVLQKSLLASIKIAQKSGIFTGTDAEVDQKALRMALEIERALHDTQQPREAYTAQARKLGANLKSNQELCDGLLSDSLSPNELVVMTDDEMASQELQKTMAEMKARADKQSIMLVDDGPRVRRTHKGEEIIEQEGSEVPLEEMSVSRRKSIIDPNQGMGARSREGSVGDGPSELPQDIDDYPSQDNIRAAALPSHPISIDTKPPVARKSSAVGNFDIDKVFNSVKSPTIPQHHRTISNQGLPRPGPGEDEDIDRMLEDGNESPPYSPTEEAIDPSIVWSGGVVMTSIGEFKANARHLGGADLTQVGTKYTDIVPAALNVAGRIDQEKANEYLCSLRYSPLTDVTVLALEPKGENGVTEFTKIFDYFYTKKRYAVIGDKVNAQVRDTYLVPVAAGDEKAGPEFLMNFVNNHLPPVRQDPMLLVALVIRNPPPQTLPQVGATAEGVASPSTLTNHPQRQMSMSGSQTGPQMSPITAQGAFATPNTPLPPQQLGHGAPSPPDDAIRQRGEAQAKGEQHAREILGVHFDSPTVGFLLPQAWQMQPNEWTIIREILVKEPKSKNDLKFLSDLLEKRRPEEGSSATTAGKT